MGLGLLGRALAGGAVGYAAGKQQEYEQQSKMDQLSKEHEYALQLERQRAADMLANTDYKAQLDASAKEAERKRNSAAIDASQSGADYPSKVGILGRESGMDPGKYAELIKPDKTSPDKPLVIPEGGAYVDQSGKVIYKNPKTFSPDQNKEGDKTLKTKDLNDLFSYKKTMGKITNVQDRDEMGNPVGETRQVLGPGQSVEKVDSQSMNAFIRHAGKNPSMSDYAKWLDNGAPGASERFMRENGLITRPSKPATRPFNPADFMRK